MFTSLGKIKHPLTRSAAAAATAFSVITIVSGMVIGVTRPKDESAIKIAVYASLLSAGCGALFGLTFVSKEKSTPAPNSISETGNKTWQDWRNFVVVRKVKESEEITSFYLKPQDQGEIPNFQPGQFLTIKLDIPGQSKPVIRTYSLSDYQDPCQYYRLSIKREPAPKGLDVLPGIASNFMHNQIEAGSVIPAKPPNGKFILNVQNSCPAVLISNGVGITPMISMAKACSRLNSNRPIWFLHGTRDGSFHAFRDEVREISQQNSNLRLHFRYSRPRPEDEGHYHGVGYVDAALIREVIAPEIEKVYGSTDAEYFLCGSPPFMQSLRDGLKAGGVPESRVFFESFSKGSKMTAEKTTKEGESAEVVFENSGKTLTWHPGDGTILEFAEANGLNPAFSCRAGICLTCMCQIKEGEVAYLEPPTGTPDQGSVLICISQPKTSKVVLDL